MSIGYDFSLGSNMRSKSDIGFARSANTPSPRGWLRPRGIALPRRGTTSPGEKVQLYIRRRILPPGDYY